MRFNILVNGDFASNANPISVSLVGGSPSGGAVNTFNDTLVQGWTLMADETNATSTVGQAAVSVTTDSLVNLAASTGLVLPAHLQGWAGCMAKVTSSGVFTSGANANISLAQTIVGGPRAAGGKSCLLEFHVGCAGYGSVKFTLAQNVSGTPTVLLSETVPLKSGAFTPVRRSFVPPLLPAGVGESYTLTITLDNGSDVQIGTTGALIIAGCYIGVPLTEDRFDPLQRLIPLV